MADQKICYVAESAGSPENKHCPDCDMPLLYHGDGVEDGFSGIYPVPSFYAAGDLRGWKIDKSDWVEWLKPLPASGAIDIPIPLGFDHLCVKYNSEGGARINIVAVDLKTGHKLRPASTQANGTDPYCPVKEAKIGDNEFAVSSLVWDAHQPIRIFEQGKALGAWTCEPASTPGTMHLWAKEYLDAPLPQLATDSGYGFRFVSWVRNRLSNWTEGQEHQWGSDSDEIEFDKNSYQGLIAYYEYRKLNIGDRHVEWPTTKPGPIDYGRPLPFPADLTDLLARHLRVGDRASLEQLRRAANLLRWNFETPER